MRQVHELKIWPQYYAQVASGQKTFEYRENDRNFQKGDKVILKEWDPTPINPEFTPQIGFTGSPHLEFVIGYVLPVEREKVIFSLLPIPKPKEPEAEAGPKAKKAKAT